MAYYEPNSVDACLMNWFYCDCEYEESEKNTTKSDLNLNGCHLSDNVCEGFPLSRTHYFQLYFVG